LMNMQAGQPQLYESLTKMLTPDESAIVQGVIMQANANEQQAIAPANGGA